MLRWITAPRLTTQMPPGGRLGAFPILRAEKIKKRKTQGGSREAARAPIRDSRLVRNGETIGASSNSPTCGVVL